VEFHPQWASYWRARTGGHVASISVGIFRRASDRASAPARQCRLLRVCLASCLAVCGIIAVAIRRRSAVLSTLFNPANKVKEGECK